MSAFSWVTTQFLFSRLTTAEETLAAASAAKPYISPEIPETGGVEYVSQDIFDTCEYDDVVYTLWADGVLTDENDGPVADADANVGIEAIERFNELAVHDSVYVLNHEQKLRYEILKDLRMFAELVNPIDLE